MNTEQMSMAELRAAHQSETDPERKRELYSAQIQRSKETWAGEPQYPCRSRPCHEWMQEFFELYAV